VEMVGLSDVGCKARTKALRLCGCTRWQSIEICV
jgi:hypothetical protein